MTSYFRKFMLTTHITFSVSWMGAVAGFLTLAITGLVSKDILIVRSAYLSMRLIAWYVILPVSTAALISGLIVSLGSNWGLFRYSWVLTKFLLTCLAYIILLLKLAPIDHVAKMITKTSLSGVDLYHIRLSLVAHAGGGLLVLLVNTVLGVYKPWGKTRYGLRKDDKPNTGSSVSRSVPNTRWKRTYLIIGFISLVILFIIMHIIHHGTGSP